MWLEKLFGLLCRPLASFLPRDDDDDPPKAEPGTPEPTPDDAPPTEAPAEPAGPPDDTPPAPEPEAIERATDLESANARIEALTKQHADLEGSIPQLVEQRAEKVLLDIFPDGPGGPAPIADAPPDPRVHPEAYREAPPDGTPAAGDEDQTIEERMTALEQRGQQAEVNSEMLQLDAELVRLKEKFPEFRKHEILLFLTRAGDQRVNLERLCEQHHNRNLAEKEEYHQAQLAKLRGTPAAPTIPTRPAGAPGSTPPPGPKTWTDAKALMKQRGREMGWK